MKRAIILTVLALCVSNIFAAKSSSFEIVTMLQVNGQEQSGGGLYFRTENMPISGYYILSRSDTQFREILSMLFFCKSNRVPIKISYNNSGSDGIVKYIETQEAP